MAIKELPGTIETAPMLDAMVPVAGSPADLSEIAHMEDTPAYKTLKQADLLATGYRKKSFEDIFDCGDLKPNSSKQSNMWERFKYGYFCCPVVGAIAYNVTHTELFVPAGHVGLMMDEQQNYLFAMPGMHNIGSMFVKHIATEPLPSNGQLRHGNRTILVVEQGFVGIATDNGQPVLFPPGIHVWTSETLRYQESVGLDQHNICLGPYTLLTVDEGYAAVTQNNGKQQIMPGGFTHLLNHKNWRFEKFITLKIQTDDLEKIQATSADNITMSITSTVTWRVVNPTLAATMAAETMAVAKGKAVSSDITKLRQDVLKQAIASLASFIGGVNYSDSFHMAARAQGRRAADEREAVGSLVTGLPEPESEERMGKNENPLYDSSRMTDAVAHANQITNKYGVEILSINILSALPDDAQLTKALACGAVASAEALQRETAARGNAKAAKIDAAAAAEKALIEAEGLAQAEIIRAKATGESARIIADGNKQAADLISTSDVAIELAKMDKSASLIGSSDKFFFGQEPSYLANLVLKDSRAAISA